MRFSLSEYTKIDVGRSYSAPPDPLAGFKGALRGRRGLESRAGKD